LRRLEDACGGTGVLENAAVEDEITGGVGGGPDGAGGAAVDGLYNLQLKMRKRNRLFTGKNYNF
jgi:hypothetical protein